MTSKKEISKKNEQTKNTSDKINKELEKLVQEKNEIGLQVAAYLDGKLVVDSWAGMADESSQRPVDRDTLFPTFSISKGITATCIHILADRGMLDYDTSVAHYWPEFGAAGKKDVTIRHVLTHQSGISSDPKDLDIKMMLDWDIVRELVEELELRWELGTKIAYLPLSYGWILGEVVRRVYGESISVFLQEEICKPLDIDGLYFGVPTSEEEKIATLKNAPGLREYAARFGLPLDHPMSDTAATFNRSDVRRAVLPGAGAIANARSLARHYAMLAYGGELDGVRILSSELIYDAASTQDEDPEKAEIRWWSSHGLGYTLGGGPGPREDLPNSFGYEGIGTLAFADPDRNFSFALLKNFLDESHPNEFYKVEHILNKVQGVLGIE